MPVRQTRERILEATLRVLARGEDPSFARVAREAELPERTLYRHFDTREALEQAGWRRALERFGVERHPTDLDDLVRLLRETYARFGADAGLVRAILRSPGAATLRAQDAEGRRDAYRALATREAPDLCAADQERLGAALRILYSAPAWDLLTGALGFDDAGAAAAAEAAARWMVQGARTPRRHE